MRNFLTVISSKLIQYKRAIASTENLLACATSDSKFCGERRLEDVVSDNLQLYSVIHRRLGARRDVLYAILDLLQEYLDNLVATGSSHNQDNCLRYFNIWSFISFAAGYDREAKFLRDRVGHFVQRLQKSNRNLRGHFDSLYADLTDIEDFGDVSQKHLLSGGRTIPIQRYLDITSTLACGCSRVREFLSLE